MQESCPQSPKKYTAAFPGSPEVQSDAIIPVVNVGADHPGRTGDMVLKSNIITPSSFRINPQNIYIN